jgi:hypothetical protein
MTIYKGRSGAVSYGHDVGILMLDCFNPFVPGDVGNAYSYGYPVLYKLVTDLSSPMVRSGGDGAIKHLVAAAIDLEKQGVKAITSDCGYMLHYQEIVSSSVTIPVMLSSLLQLPFIASTLPKKAAIGVICANASQFTDALLDKAYPHRTRPIHIRGLENSIVFRGAFLDESGHLDTAIVTDEVCAVAKALVTDHPEIGAILLECSNLPPYAHSVQGVTGLPVYDFLTMINQVRESVARRPYSGGY